MFLVLRIIYMTNERECIVKAVFLCVKESIFVCSVCVCCMISQSFENGFNCIWIFNGRLYRCYLLGRGRLSTIVGVETGVFFVALFVAAVAGAALPDRICRFGDPSTFDGVGPTDCDRSAYE